MSRRFRSSTTWRLLAGAASVAAASGTGCSSADDAASAAKSCLSTREFFEQKAWPEVFAKTCLKCHSPDGLAAEKNAKLKLLPSAYPGFLDANLDNVLAVAKIELDGKSELLRKPVGEMSHGGDQVIQPGSPEYKTLEELVKRMGGAESCPKTATVASFDDVVLLDALGTLRKASLELVGRLPTAQEIQSVTDGGDAALAPLLLELMKEPAFYVRLMDLYNDVFLTDQFLSYSGYGAQLLNDADFPTSDARFDALPDDVKLKTNRALAREPLQLIAHIVQNDRPFTEVLTAGYTVVNPFSAPLLNVTNVAFTDPNDESEFHEAQIVVQRNGAALPYPHSGILTSPMWLNRFQTTPTNRNRHRARAVMQTFLATDILKVAERPIDPLAATQYANPTRDDSSCTSCHRQIDPIAGAFQKWDDYDQEKYQPDATWHQEMFPPGFGEEVMQTSDYANAARWLADRIVRDRRFLLAMVRTVFQGLTGQAPLEYPVDTTSATYKNALASWDAQDATFRAISDAFVNENYNLKAIVREVVLTPYFRARNATGPLSAERATELGAVGTGHLLTPELLSRKIGAVTGVPWTRNWDKQSWLTTDYRILYGGMDSNTVTTRLSVPNGVMSNVARRMANEVACATTAWDFTKAPEQRLLFPKVSIDQVPETSGGDAVPAAIDAIKQNIVYLHAHVLGESVTVDDAEAARTYQLFYDTWKEGSAAVASGALPKGLVWGCRARTDPATGVDLPAATQLEQDDQYSVRAWMAVVTYLLSDYQFLYE